MNSHEIMYSTSNAMDIALVTPGIKPLPPAKCTSIEIYVYQLAKQLAQSNQVRLFALGRPKGTEIQDKIIINKLSPVPSVSSYLSWVTNDLLNSPTSIIQVDNRPSYPIILRQKIDRPIVLNIHSTTFTSSNAIHPDKLRKSLELSDAIVVCSKYLKSELESRFHEFKEKIHVIYSGADIEQFPSRTSSEGQAIREQVRHELSVSDKTVLLYVGRFVPRKGIALLIKAFSKVNKEFPKTELWIVGGQPSDKRKRFHNEVAELSQGLPIKFIPFVPHKVLYKYYLSADLLVCPSQLSEGFPLVNMEAASCGLPAIGSDNWGIREGIVEGVNGWRVNQYQSQDAWSNKLCTLLGKPNLLKSSGNSARIWAEENFTWKRVANDFQKLYRTLI
jgi:spore coat protein SA